MTQLRYGVLAPNTSLNDAIYRCFEDVPASVADEVAKQLKAQRQNIREIASHTIRELVIGAYLARNGFGIDYERELPPSRKTPDWTLLDAEAKPLGIVEVTNHHLGRGLSRTIEQARVDGTSPVYYPENKGPIRRKVAKKVDKYAQLAMDGGLPFVVALFAHFDTGTDEDDLVPCIGPQADALFSENPALSGLLFVDDGVRVDVAAVLRGEQIPTGYAHHFRYWPNPNATKHISLPAADWTSPARIPLTHQQIPWGRRPTDRLSVSYPGQNPIFDCLDGRP